MSEPTRGFIAEWSPHAKTRDLLANVLAILDLYQAQRPLTLRQIYYRLIAEYGFPKSDNKLRSFMDAMVNARRARWTTNDGELLFDVIRDDTAIRHPAFFYDGAAHFLRSTRYSAEELRLDRMEDQPRRLVLWCEAAGMVPQLRRIADPYGIGIYCGGSTGINQNTARGG